MARVANAAAGKVLQLITTPSGLSSNIAQLSQSEGVSLSQIEGRQIVMHNVSFDLAERSAETKYPALHIYCEKIANKLKEKFRTFSGNAYMAIEVRLSQDRLEGLERKLQLYVDAISQVLDQNRGNWGQGLFYAGGYEALFGPVKHGGRNFIQIAKITFELDVSSN